eukprot:5510530-Karenia_brevis.AAC.1
MPRMLNRVGSQGVVVHGFMPQLAPLLGDGSFDAGVEAERFSVLLGTDLQLATEFCNTWRGLRAE